MLSPVAGDGFQGRDSPCGAHRQMRGAGAPASTGGAAGTEIQLVVTHHRRQFVISLVFVQGLFHGVFFSPICFKLNFLLFFFFTLAASPAKE